MGEPPSTKQELLGERWYCCRAPRVDPNADALPSGLHDPPNAPDATDRACAAEVLAGYLGQGPMGDDGRSYLLHVMGIVALPGPMLLSNLAAPRRFRGLAIQMEEQHSPRFLDHLQRSADGAPPDCIPGVPPNVVVRLPNSHAHARLARTWKRLAAPQFTAPAPWISLGELWGLAQQTCRLRPLFQAWIYPFLIILTLQQQRGAQSSRRRMPPHSTRALSSRRRTSLH